ncbi:MAG TPA: PIN domain-containing protein [Gammaproteobacteria bacterium]|nr:PIN domain-containing protein [Gammaproteobacteria bacterium]
MIGIDTNVLVRYLTRDDPLQAEMAREFLLNACTPEEPGVIDRVVLCELVWVLERSYGYSRSQITQTLEKLFRTRQLVIENPGAAMSALRLYRQGRTDYADALIGVGNRLTGCENTVTFDRKAAKLDEFRLLDSRSIP